MSLPTGHRRPKLTSCSRPAKLRRFASCQKAACPRLKTYRVRSWPSSLCCPMCVPARPVITRTAGPRRKRRCQRPFGAVFHPTRWAQDLYGDLTVEFGIGGPPHFTHATFTELDRDAVMRNGGLRTHCAISGIVPPFALVKRKQESDRTSTDYCPTQAIAVT